MATWLDRIKDILAPRRQDAPSELAAARADQEELHSLYYEAHDNGWIEEHREMEARAAERVEKLEGKNGPPPAEAHIEHETEPPVEDFYSNNIRKVVDQADFLLNTSYELYGNRACPRTDLECMDVMAVDESGWGSLSREQRTEVLNRYIDWTHFAPVQADKIIDNIAARQERQRWFDGVPTGWRGFGERDVQEWIAFERLPEAEQVREAARMMKQSMTLGGDGVMVHAKWEEMNDRQRRDVIFHHLRTSEGSELSYHQWKEIVKEELGYWPGEQTPPTVEQAAPEPSKPNLLDHARQWARDAAAQQGREQGREMGD